MEKENYTTMYNNKNTQRNMSKNLENPCFFLCRYKKNYYLLEVNILMFYNAYFVYI